MNRRSLTVLAVYAALAGGLSTAWGQTGPEIPSLAAYDQFMGAFLSKWQIPGGALAVSRNGQLIYARGFGLADRESVEAVRPDTLFRIASVSKPLTAVAVMKLIQEGRLSLDTRVFELMPEYLPHPRPAGFDDRILEITIRQLLHHTGGWDRDANGWDPMDRTVDAARITGEPSPGVCPTVIRAMLATFRLDFPPGQRFAYSNLGYCVLGRVIEKISGEGYERYVQEQLLRPAGIDRIRLGRTLLQDRAPGEVKYYDNGPNVPAVFSTGPRMVARPYGGFHLEAMDSHGGWLASVVDLVKFADAVDGRRGAAILNSTTLREMLTRPVAPVSQSGGIWYGKGWTVVSTGGSRDRWEHDGGLPGSMAYLVHAANGFTWAVLFNHRPSQEAYGELSSGLWQAFQSVTRWPEHDLHPDFSSAGLRPRLSPTMAVTNGASFEPGIVAGSWVSLRGFNLAGTARSWQQEDFDGSRLPASLDGVRVLMNGSPAAISYVSETQINAQAPDLGPGAAWVQVVRNDEASEPVRVEVKGSAPGVFMYQQGQRFVAAATHADGTLIGDSMALASSRAAIPGGKVLLFATGLAPSTAGKTIETPVELLQPLEVHIGDKAARVEYTGLVGPGLFQINIVVPDLTPGDHEVRLEVGGQKSRTGVFLPVR